MLPRNIEGISRRSGSEGGCEAAERDAPQRTRATSGVTPEVSVKVLVMT